MSVLDMINQRRDVKQYDSAQLAAVKMFEQQKNSIKALKGLRGLETIQDYWTRIRDINEEMFDKAKMADKDRYFALYRQAKDFLRFVDNLLNK